MVDPGIQRTVAEEYPYTDSDGNVLYVVKRFIPKSFAQFKPDGRPGLDGIERVPYNLPAVVKASEVWIVEGEKDANTLISEGYCATTFPGGAKWKPEYLKWFTGRKVNVVPDNDKTGGVAAEKIVEALRSAEVVTDVYSCAPFKDVTEMYETTGKIELAIEESSTLIGTWNPTWGSGIKDVSTPTPSVLEFGQTGIKLLYRGKINGLFGESESGKTWTALHAVQEVLEDGGSVVYYDFEDDGPSIVARLKDLGVRDEDLERFGYVRPGNALGKREAFIPIAATLTVFDGLTELFALFDRDINSATDLAFIENTLLQPTASAGSVVLVIHHAPHEGDRPAGTQHMKSMLSGAAYLIKPGLGNNPAKIWIYKDRPNGVRKHFSKGTYSIGQLIVQPSTVDPTKTIVRFSPWLNESSS